MLFWRLGATTENTNFLSPTSWQCSIEGTWSASTLLEPIGQPLNYPGILVVSVKDSLVLPVTLAEPVQKCFLKEETGQPLV